MTRIFYDTEFLEDGKTIDLISIGMVREDGAEYYAVSEEATKRRLRRRIKKHDWLMANVVPSLPKWHGDANLYAPKRWLFNYSDPCVRPRDTIARDVRRFILAYGPDVQLWADYCAYDHVALCQLFGRMIDLPDGVPMYTNDFQQLLARAGHPDIPSLPGIRQHNALDDARELKFRFDWLARLEAQKKVTDGQG